MPSKHYPFGGSTIVRTEHCPSWRKLADAAPKIPRQMADANRGSALHEGAEWCILEERVPAELIGKHYAEFDYTITAEDAEQLQIALDAAYVVFDKYGVTEFVTEQLLEHSEDTGGSADLIAIGEIGGQHYRLILDWKFGHQPVRAIKQTAFYDMCGARTPDIKDFYTVERDVVAVTIQPQVSADADCYEFEKEELAETQKNFLRAIEQARLGDLPPVTGPHCQYCPAAPYCPAKREAVTRFLHLDPKQTEQLAEGMQMVEQMKEQIKAIEAEVFAALQNDEKVPGWKLVEKQKRRYWIDEKPVIDMLDAAGVEYEDYTDLSLKSVAQVEKVLKKANPELLEKLPEYVDNRSSGLTIAKDSDKRPAVPGKNQTPEALDALMKGAA